ncbi:MAG: flagellar basal body rod protein FlgC [Pseudomonadota bacterium]
MSLFNVFDVAGSAMNAQSMRLNVTASNLANADAVSTTAAGAYRARHPVFQTAMVGANAASAEEPAAAGVRVLDVVQSDTTPVRRHDPGNPLADAEGYVWGSNVNPVEEMANMISASRSYQGSVEVMTTSRDLLLKTLAMGR